MKKILFTCLLMMLFLVCKTNCHAEENYIYLGDQIPNLRLYLKTPTTEKYKGMFLIKNRNTGEYVYCIEPGVNLKNGNFKAYQSLRELESILGITQEDWDNIRTIGYYGIGYKDRTDIKWYAAAQYLIWEYLLEGKGEIYFVDENNNKIEPLKEEIDAICYDLSRHNLMPSFLHELDGLVFHVGDTITLTDEYNILEDFAISKGNFNALVTGNKLTIEFTKAGEESILFRRNMREENIAKIFYAPSSQTVMNRSAAATIYDRAYFYVTSPSLTIIKKDAQSGAKLANATYEIYYEWGSLYTTVTTNEEGVAYLSEIPEGKYYLKEVQAPYGYKLNTDVINFEVEKDDIVIEATNDLIIREIKIAKYLENADKSLKLESNAEFQIFDSNKNLIDTIKTDKYGIASISLSYGTYIIHQTKGMDGYRYIDDTTFRVDEDSTNFISLKNTQLVGFLEVVKKDTDTLEIINNEAEFKIYDINKNEYIKIDNNDTFKTIDGVLKIDNIPYGEYELIELKAPLSYELAEESIFFTIEGEEKVVLEVTNSKIKGTILVIKKDIDTGNIIKDEAIFQIYDKANKKYLSVDGENVFKTVDGMFKLENIIYGDYELVEISAPNSYILTNERIAFSIKNNEELTIDVFNKQKNGSLQIEKLDSDNLEPLEGVIFGLYDSLYQLLGEYKTDDNGIILIDNIISGDYYIKEISTINDYELLEGFMPVQIKNNTLTSLKVTNRVKINVPKTGVNEIKMSHISSVLMFLGVSLYFYGKKH